jgi:hypothetical protein
MRTVRSAAIAALLSCSLITPAFASHITPTIAPSTAATPEMVNNCETYRTTIANTAYAPREFTASRVDYVVYSIAWNADADSSVPDNLTRKPLGSVVSFSNFDFTGVNTSNMGRSGGSVNLFSDAVIAKTVNYSNSSVEVTDTYSGQVNYDYKCVLTEKITIPGQPAGQRLEKIGECVSRIQTAGSQQNDAQEFCKIEANRQQVFDPGAPDTYDYQETLTYGLPFGGFGAVSAPITGTAQRLNENAGPWTFQNQSLPVTAMICNNPGSKGGAWRGANGYSGAGCTTAVFDMAQQLRGNDFAIIPSNSLPAS